MILGCKNGKPYLKEKPVTQTQSQQSNEQIIKLMVVGDSGTGKSCFVSQKFNEAHLSTIGVDFAVYHHQLPNGNKIKFQAWDTSGHMFQSQTKPFYKVSGFMFFFYDVSKKQSFNRVKQYLDMMIDQNLINPKCKGMLIGNKNDLESQVIDKEAVEQLAEKIGFFKEISVKNNPQSLSQLYQLIYEAVHDPNYLSLYERSDKFTAPIQEKKEQPKASIKSEQEVKYLYKVVMVGAQNVGKTSICQQYYCGEFPEMHRPTIGVQFVTKVIETNGIKVKLQIWDTAGQERFKAITRCYYRQSRIVFLIYDCQNRQTFNMIHNYHKQITNQLADQNLVYMCLVGNKNDELDKRQVSCEEGMQLASELNMDFVEITAKNRESVQSIFYNASDWILKKECLVNTANY